MYMLHAVYTLLTQTTRRVREDEREREGKH